jgi:hypothetical protein
VPTVLKSGSLKLLEPSGPVKACNGIAFTDVGKGEYIFVHPVSTDSVSAVYRGSKTIEDERTIGS